MKKKFETVGRALFLLLTLMSLSLLQTDALRVCAADSGQAPGSLTKVIPLSDGEIRQVPRYIAEAGAVYKLDESTIAVGETGRESSEGADVVTFSRKVEDLPDNDLERIEKQAVFDGISCALLSVAYEVAQREENGIPTGYTAVCEYGGLKKYSTSYPSAWQMTVRYDLCELPVEEGVTEWETFEYELVPTKKVEGERRSGEAELAGEEEAQVPRAAVRKFRIKPIPEKEEGERTKKKISDIAVPLAAAAAGTGAAVPFILWILFSTAPLFSLKEAGKYRCIGRIRIKKADGAYTGYLTKRLLARAELPVFRIKLSGRHRKTGKSNLFYVHCPDGKRIAAILGKTVHFTVEGD